MISICFIDATFGSAKGDGDGIGKIDRGKGVKILAIIVDRQYLAAGGRHPRGKLP